MRLTYRRARPGDAAACIALRGRTRQNAIPAERLAALGITPETWDASIRTGAVTGVVCQRQGGLAGYCFGDRASGEVLVLALLPDVEGRGVGRTLLARVVAELAIPGRSRLFLSCSADPASRSHGFYRHLGWQSTHRLDEHGDEILDYLLTPPGQA